MLGESLLVATMCLIYESQWKLPFFYRAARNQGVAVLKEALKSTRIQKMARNATYVIFGRTDLSKYADIMNRP